MFTRALAVAICVFGPLPAFADSAFILFEQAKCLRDNADRYLEVIDGPTLVFPGFCEEGIFSPTPEEIARATSQNSGYGASIISFDYVSPDAGDSVGEFPANSKAAILVLSPELMTCLRDRFDEVSLLHRPEVPDLGPVEVAELIFTRCR